VDGPAYAESGGVAAPRRALAIAPSSLPPALKEARLAALRIIELLIRLSCQTQAVRRRLRPTWPNTVTLAYDEVSAHRQILVIRCARTPAGPGLGNRTPAPGHGLVQTDANPGGLPKTVFDDLQAQLAANRSVFCRALPSVPF
jgi:hypothetical protein